MTPRQPTKEEWVQSLEMASRDPLYLADIEQVEKDFEYADAEAASMIDEIEEARLEEKPL